MGKYSFLLQSKEPDYFILSPTLRLRKYGGWLVAESIEQEEISKAQSQATIRAVQLAKRIASVKNIPLDEAFGLLQGGGGMSEIELLGEFTDETLGMLNNSTSVEMGNAKVITAFMRCRGEGLIDDEWALLDDWSIEDTKGMAKPMIDSLLEFITDEQRGDIKEGSAAKKSRKKIQTEEEVLPSD